MKQAVGMEGVEIDLQVPVVIGRDKRVVTGKVLLAAERPQSFSWVRVELQREERNEAAAATTTTTTAL